MEDLLAKRAEIEAEGGHPEEIAKKISDLYPEHTLPVVDAPQEEPDANA